MEESPKRGLLAAYARLLGPLIRILIRNGVSFSEFSEVARQAYVEVASRDFKVGEAKASQSRLAILTGLTKEEVEHIRHEQELAASERLNSTLNQVVHILAGWHTDSEFTGPYGVPLELRIDDQHGKSFKLLCERYCPDADASALLKELLRVGVVRETSEGWFKAVTRTYLLEGDVTHGMEHLTEAVENIVTTMDHNITESNPDKRLLERQVYADDGIHPEDLPRFRRFIKKHSQVYLDQIDNWLSQLDRPNSKSKSKTINTGIGVYHFIKHEDKTKIDRS
ncbi:MAG: hypothetical protein GY886_08660 [Gammaproteobacteria bacterium]|nr:hypothetical protein [Gammaproteobacteria bacterium]MCP4832265.1 hypothetical protein [Gammaproteobacteria bacterium]